MWGFNWYVNIENVVVMFEILFVNIDFYVFWYNKINDCI